MVRSRSRQRRPRGRHPAGVGQADDEVGVEGLDLATECAGRKPCSVQESLYFIL